MLKLIIAAAVLLSPAAASAQAEPLASAKKPMLYLSCPEELSSGKGCGLILDNIEGRTTAEAEAACRTLMRHMPIMVRMTYVPESEMHMVATVHASEENNAFACASLVASEMSRMSPTKAESRTP